MKKRITFAVAAITSGFAGVAAASDFSTKATPAGDAASGPAPLAVSVEGGVMFSDFTRNGLDSGLISSYGSGISGPQPSTDFGAYGAVSAGRALGGNWDWRLSGSYGSFLKNERPMDYRSGPATATIAFSDQFSSSTAGFDIGRTWRDRNSVVRMFAGLRGAYLLDDHGQSVSAYSSPPPTAFDLLSSTSTAFLGAGPDLGIEGSYKLDEAGLWAITGTASGAYLAGARNSSVNASASQTISGVTASQSASLGDTHFTSAGNVSGSLGVSFQFVKSTALTVGYRADYWVNVPVTSPAAPYNNFDRTQNILSHMPFARINVEF